MSPNRLDGLEIQIIVHPQPPHAVVQMTAVLTSQIQELSPVTRKSNFLPALHCILLFDFSKSFSKGMNLLKCLVPLFSSDICQQVGR